MDIKGLTNELVKKHMTRNPIELARELGITVLFENLGRINGFYNTSINLKFIHINRKLKGQKMILTVAHELGHVIMHPDSNTPFMREHTYFSISRYETEANKFAVHLLISDNELQELHNMSYTTGQIAGYYGLPEKLIELRLQDTF